MNIAFQAARPARAQLINNTVNVAMGSQSEQFVRLADGSFNPRLGSSNRLSLEGGAYTLTVKDGTTFNFAPSGNIRDMAEYVRCFGCLRVRCFDAAPSLTEFEYDSLGNRTAIVADAANLRRTTSIAYDSVGNAISITDPKGGVTTNSWDAARRLLTTTSPATPSAPSGLVTANTYDANGQVLQVRQMAYGTALTTASATYTVTGKAATTTDARGNVTRYAYDLLDRLVSVTDPMNRLTQFTYTWTDDGLRASLKDANGNTTGFAYDRFNRLITTTYPDSSTESATWDAASNMRTRITRAGATLRYGYDTLNRLVTKTAAAAPVGCNAAASGTPTVTYSYDLASRVTGVCDNGAVIPAVTPPANAIVYDTAYSYNAIGRPTGVTFDPVPTPILPPTASVTTFDFGYNAANQRVSFGASDSAWIDYPPAADMLTTYTANILNQYTFVGGVGFVVPTYDGNGNLTSDGTFTFGYDTENGLVSASKFDTSASYAFDAQGRRKAKSITTGPYTTTTVFVTDADNREVLEYDGDTGAILRWYAYGLGPNEVLAQANLGSGTLATPIPDLLGSIIATLDPGGGPFARHGYKPYGDSSSAPSQFGFTGQRIDGELGGLYSYRAREYMPTWGRFLQADPIGYASGPNLYAYVENDPLSNVDPDGRCPTCLVGGLLNVGIGYGIAKLTGQDYSLGGAALDFGVGFATSGLAVLSAARRGVQIAEGIYVANASSGLSYVGQSGDIAGRLAQHVASGKITERAARSAQKFEVLGGKTSREVAEQAAIDARGGIGNLANYLNPIGGRTYLANNPALGNVTKNNLVNWPAVIGADVGISTLFQSSPAQALGGAGQPSTK